MFLCNPHNPGGRVWDREVLEKIGHLCQKHGVLLVSDEIHQDLALFGHRHTSFNTVDPSFKDFSLILTSATKTFNIAGTKIPMWSLKIQSFVRLFKQRQLANNQHGISGLGYIATEAAYRHGKPLVDGAQASL